MRFSGKTVVVTGGASGIGAETVRLFAGEGADVVSADIDEDTGRRIAEECEGEVRFVRCDVTDPADIEALMNVAAEASGGIDTVFNNAGAGGARASIAEIEPDEWDRTMDLLLRSVAFGIRYAVPHMKDRKGASIVNTSSVAAVGPGYAPTAYSVAKAGVLHLTKVAATDLAQFGIRVNAVQPGFINTNIFTASLGIGGVMQRMANNAIAQMSANAQPVPRGGQASDIAEAVAYLASEAAGFVTGTSILVDGGITLGPRHSWDPEEPGLFDALDTMANAQQGQEPTAD
ncbi:SDR family NAD(P)-dependent oxidoreductase [Erythrobacter litoralis]|uniref:SDR family NAD(P)-dependent oxidoreductase n=1 Tax=Erythrobacter litoralis TaxID=39960 RepID=UPI00243587A8|nr:SDR family NAD(P)-dependent oxidoreductase [Erythrobacter litoralis]